VIKKRGKEEKKKERIRKNLGVFKEYNLCEFARKKIFHNVRRNQKMNNSDELLTIQNKT
jgi:hypothetical protein